MWEYNCNPNSDELYHYGVLGMKWGVRRYQNYSGTYTQAGMKRFNKSMDSYEKADSRYKAAKKNKKSDAEITNARMARKQTKERLNKDYRHLRQDKLGDQGKDLYSRGKTITGNSNVSRVLGTIGSMGLSAAAYNYKTGTLGNDKVTKYLAAAGTAAMTVSAAKKMADEYQAKRLRAYYSHTSNY